MPPADEAREDEGILRAHGDGRELRHACTPRQTERPLVDGTSAGEVVEEGPASLADDAFQASLDQLRTQPCGVDTVTRSDEQLARLGHASTRVFGRGGARHDQRGQRGLGVRRITPRQVEVLSGMARGWSNRRIAEELTLTTRTVESIISNIITNLDLREGEDGNNPRVSSVLVYLQHAALELHSGAVSNGAEPSD